MPDTLTAADAMVSIVVGLATLVTLIIGWIYAGKPLWDYLKEKKARRRLKECTLEFELDWMQQNSVIPMFRLSPDLKCTWVNEALCDLLDIDSAELKGKGWFRIIRPDQLDTVTKKWEAAVRKQCDYTNRQYMWINGKYRETSVTGDVFVYAGKVREFLGTVKVLEEV